MSKEEVTALLNGMKDSSQFYTNGVHVAGTRYIYLSGSDVLVRARKGTDGLHCTKTSQGRTVKDNEYVVRACRLY